MHAEASEVGKLADLSVLERNLCEVEPKQISDVTLLLTMMNGQVTHRENGS